MTTNCAESDVRRIRLFTWGRVSHPKGEFEVNEAFYKSLAEHFADRAKGVIPIARQHQEDGYTYGRLAEIGKDEEGIWGDVEFAKGMAQKFDDGFLDSWSPSFFTEYKDPHTGKTYKYALREVSFVTVRHLKNLPGASPHYALAEEGTYSQIINVKEDTMATENQEAPTTALEEGEDKEKSMGERMEAMEKNFSELAAALKPMMEHYKKNMEAEGEEEESTDNAEANKQIAGLAKRVRELSEENARLDVRRRLGEGCPQEASLIKLRQRDAELYESTVTALAEAKAAPVLAAPTTGTEERGGQAPKPTPVGKRKLVSLCEQLKEQGVSLGSNDFFVGLQEGGVDLEKDYDVAIARKVYCV